MSTNNPLKQYFRSIKLYTKLPSGTTYYDNVDFNDDGELGIMAMTAKDEMTARNPDALLNGEAIVDLINSCVPGVPNPKKLLANDIDALMIAIRHATYGDDIEINSVCPKCKHDNLFKVNVGQSLSSMTMLEEDYSISLSSGITIHVQPYGYKETVKALKAQFEQMKIARDIDSDTMQDDQRLKLFSTSFKTIANLNLNLLTSCIIKITHGKDGVVTNREHILDFLQNVEKDVYTQLDKLVKDINQVGVKKDFTAKCEKCEHEWQADVDFNPVNFFTES